MSTMKEMARAYRAETARIALRIREKTAAGAPSWEVHALREMLREMRVKQRLLDSYYEAPRDSSISMAGAYAPKRGEKE